MAASCASPRSVMPTSKRPKLVSAGSCLRYSIPLSVTAGLRRMLSAVSFVKPPIAWRPALSICASSSESSVRPRSTRPAERRRW